MTKLERRDRRRANACLKQMLWVAGPNGPGASYIARPIVDALKREREEAYSAGYEAAGGFVMKFERKAAKR